MSSATPLSSQILKIPRSDEPGAYVLLHVSRLDETALDLDLIATEGETPYNGSVRQNQLRSLCAKNYQGSDDEWRHTVARVFGQQEASSTGRSESSAIESSANIIESADEKEITITIRKRIQGITQRLGAVTLKQDDEQSIELFDWSGMAVSKADALEQRCASLLDNCRAAEDTIKELNKQVQDLIGAKRQHEEQLMANFVQLLNEKKLKIRNQQRLLASANVDPDKLSSVQSLTGGDQGQKPRNTKRSSHKATDSASEDGFDEMPPARAGQQENDRPEQLKEDDNATTEDEESAHSTSQESEAEEANQKPSFDRPTANDPPPRRQLPFQRRDQGPQPRQQNTGEDTAGETDDDEL